MAKSFKGVKEMKFSILVPVYNVENYLEQCVDSLLSQTYKGDYEIILVDDGSTDNSGEICDKYAEKFPEKIKAVHKENGGHTSARLEAIKNAKGEYCIFCDSDDFIENDLLTEVSVTLDKEPQTDMVIYGFNYYKNEQKIPKEDSVQPNVIVYEVCKKNILYSQFFQSNALNTLWTKAVRTSILKSDSTDYSKIQKFIVGEDLFVSIYLVTEASKIIWLDKCLYNYRVLENSITRSYSLDKIPRKNTLFIYERFLEYLPKWNMDDEEHINKLKNRFFGEAMYNFANFYENSKNSAERKAVVDYDWDSFLPVGFSVEEIKNRDSYSLMLYEKIKEKNYTFLRLHFLKKRIYKNIRNLKRKLFVEN